MQTDIDPRDLIGHKAVDRNGDKIGTVDEVYLDDATGEPEWAAVRTGIFGRDAFVPLTTSEFSGDELRVPYDKSLIKESPDFGVGQHLSPAQELQLYRYYGLDASGGQPPPSATNGSVPADRADHDFGTVAAAAATAHPHPTAAHQAPDTARADGKPAGHQPAPHHPSPESNVRMSAPTMQRPTAVQMPAVDPTAPSTPSVAAAAPTPEPAPVPEAPSGPVEITCREERLDITTEWHVLGTAKLRKYVTTEPVERRVPVVRERVRVERVPVTEQERAALSELEIAEATEEVTLREERPVVHKYLAPIERVRLVVERYTEEEVVREELRREQVEVQDGTVEASQDHAGPHEGEGRAAAPHPTAGHQPPAHPQAPSGPNGGHMQTLHPADLATAAYLRPEPLRPS
ncbi:DUF2382 domain-containing protein [Kitasatospora cinereorecta]|uniref:DUF2382 domain-containing protein n=1 Tax=Kitasatospora cinereorecta TaxID=285560 RepID=A0ABW0VKU5_9ACTN